MTEPYAEYYRGFREAFHMANQIAAAGSRGMEDLTLKEVIRTLANYANSEARATPAGQDAIDAQRYRFLRATTKAIRDDDGIGRVEVKPEQFDVITDAAIAASTLKP